MSEPIHDSVTTKTANTPSRDANGRFTNGNKGGPGNPFGRRIASMRQAMLDAVSEDEVAQLMRLLMQKALAGDLAAAKLVLQYVIGKPKPAAEPDRLDIEEWDVHQQSWTSPEELQSAVNSVPIKAANVTAEIFSDVQTRKIGGWYADPASLDAEIAMTQGDEDEPLTPEEEAEIEAIRRDWEESHEAESRLSLRESASTPFRGTKDDSQRASGDVPPPSLGGANGAGRRSRKNLQRKEAQSV